MEAHEANVCLVQTHDHLQRAEQSSAMIPDLEHETSRIGVSPKQPNNKPATSTTLGAVEIFLRMICTVSFLIIALYIHIASLLAI